MTNTYLLEVIKALQPSERQEMALFLASPHFNKGGNAKDLATLYRIICAAAPGFPDDLLDKDHIYRAVFPGQAVVQGKLEKLMADLNRLLRAYALTQRYFSESNEEHQQIDWAAWLRERGLAERSRQLVAKVKTLDGRDKKASLKQYRTQLLISEEEHEWESTHNQAKGDLNIPQVIHQLDLYFYNYRTELANRYLLQQKLTQLPELEFNKYGPAFYLEESILLQISKSIQDVFKKELPDIEEFQKLMQLLQTNEEHLSAQTLSQFYAFLRSSCTLLINSGHSDFVPILHQIHKSNLGKGHLFLNEGISPNVYLNLVQVAIRAKEVEWAQEFTEKYKNRIIGGDLEQFFFRYNMSLCLFAGKRFDQALDQLPEVASNSHYHHMVRRLELKLYYELGSDLLLYKLDAFRKFIERTAPKTISANLRAMDLNFLNILLQLSQSPMKDKVRSTRLIERIQSKKLLADRAWLLEKARELG